MQANELSLRIYIRFLPHTHTTFLSRYVSLVFFPLFRPFTTVWCNQQPIDELLHNTESVAFRLVETVLAAPESNDIPFKEEGYRSRPKLRLERPILNFDWANLKRLPGSYWCKHREPGCSKLDTTEIIARYFGLHELGSFKYKTWQRRDEELMGWSMTFLTRLLDLVGARFLVVS